MAWWKRPNSTVADIAEAAAAGLPFLPPSTPAGSTPGPDPTASDSSQLDLWFTATNDKLACGHFTQVIYQLCYVL